MHIDKTVKNVAINTHTLSQHKLKLIPFILVDIIDPERILHIVPFVFISAETLDNKHLIHSSQYTQGLTIFKC